MATINYLIKGKKNLVNILLRFKNGRKFDITVSTELKVEPKNWSAARQKVKLIADDFTKDEINAKLHELKNNIYQEFNLDNSDGIFIDREWLKKKTANFFNRVLENGADDKIFFVPYVENFILNAPSRIIRGKSKNVAKATITKYKTTLNKLLQFEQYQGSKIKFSGLDLKFYDAFVAYLTQVQGINVGTVGNYIGTIKLIAKDAKLKGLPVNIQIEHPNFFVPKTTSESIYLKDEEINLIYNFDLGGVERLENTRDLFIIGLRTGLRISDFRRLDLSYIKDGFIKIVTQKTEHKVTIPLHYQVKAILTKRGGFPRTISDQKFNKHVKELCKVVGFTELTYGSKINSQTRRKELGDFEKWELVSSHICRRSFATNLYGKLDNLTIMAITGQKTETQFLKYIRTTDTEKAEKLKDYWENEEADLNDFKLKII